MKGKWIRAAFLVLLSIALLLASVGCATESEPQPNGLNGDTTPPLISGVAYSGITASEATISWSTNELATTQVEYGTTTSYGSSSVLDSSLVATHTVNLTGLTAATAYHYRVKSKDSSTNEAISGDNTFTTAAPSDTTAPVISSVASTTTTSAATITWNTNEGATSQVEYGQTTGYGSTTTLDQNLVTSHSVSLSGLNATTTYHFRVQSKDASNNVATSADTSFTTLPAPDTTPPVISRVTYTDITISDATITWTTDEPSTSQVEYGTTDGYGTSSVLDGNLVTSHNVVLSGLEPGAKYHFRVRSKDSAGNEAVSIDTAFNTASAVGRVQGKIVMTGTEQPLAGALLILGKVAGQGECRLQASLVCTTSQEGSFEFTHVPPGQYVVFYDPTGTALDTWTGIDQLDISYAYGDTCTYFVSEEFWQTFGGGGAIALHTGTSMTCQDGKVTSVTGAFTSHNYRLTAEFRGSGPLMVEVIVGQIATIDITATP